MKLKVIVTALFVALLAVSGLGGTSQLFAVPVMAESNACWGQASAVFAQMGEMGKHASEMENPRDGLRNLARDLYDLGIIPDDTMEELGKFVAASLVDQNGEPLTIEACMD